MAIPGSIETDKQPPMTIPLRHFVVGLGFLLLGVLVGIGLVSGIIAGFARAAHVHLLLAGWICITIMGATTQFVPVWSGTSLYSRRLASAQLVLVAVGLLGFATAMLLGAFVWLLPFGTILLAGFWVFVANVGLTLATLDGYDRTERHFALALGFFLVLTVLGWLLAVDLTMPLFASLGVTRQSALLTHATLAVFGAVLTTVYGALYQLGTMFTQTELHGVDDYLARIEEIGHPVGVVLLALGRLSGSVTIAQVGGVFVVAAALAMATILGRKLLEMQVPRTPMHVRYAVAVPALATWALLTLPAWLDAPLSLRFLLGASGAVHLLVLGAIGFVVFGTLYHVVPFVVWVHRYSDRLGFEEVPMIDDLYADGLATADGLLLAGGTAVLVVAEWFRLLPSVTALGGALVTGGVVLFGANLVLVLRRHSPHSVGRILLGTFDPRTPSPPGGETAVDE